MEAACRIKRNYRARSQKQYLNYFHGLMRRQRTKRNRAVLKLFAGYSFSPLPTIIGNQLFHCVKTVPSMDRFNRRSHEAALGLWATRSIKRFVTNHRTNLYLRIYKKTGGRTKKYYFKLTVNDANVLRKINSRNMRVDGVSPHWKRCLVKTMLED